MTYPCPCGNCPYCRYASRRVWTMRLKLENMYWDRSSFVTLTYDPAKYDRTTLWPPHLQAFFKRLRYHLREQGRSIKYFACGEYSIEVGNNPHYHAIIYGLDENDKALLDSCWNYGFVHIGSVTEKSIMYVAGYVLKKLGKDKDRFKNKPDIFPEFIRVSQGIGLQFISDMPVFSPQIRLDGRIQYLGRYLINKLALRFDYDYKSDALAISKIKYENLKEKYWFDFCKDFGLNYTTDKELYFSETSIEPIWRGGIKIIPNNPNRLLTYAYECANIQIKRDFLARFKTFKRLQNEKIEIQSFASG